MMYFSDLFHKKFTPIDEMSAEEVIKELEKFRNLWTWIDEETQAFLSKIAYPCAITRRDYHRYIGLQGAPHFELVSVDIDVTETIFDYTAGHKIKETKTVNIPKNQIVSMDYIHEEEVQPIENPLDVAAREGQAAITD